MEAEAGVSGEVLQALRRYDTPTMANALETFNVRSWAEGFTTPEIRCLFPDLPVMVGHAVTGRIRSATVTKESYSRRPWWEYVLTIPAPRVIVFEDLDDPPGVGAFWGEVQTNIHRALGCIGVITNGSVRDLSEVHALPFHYFAGRVAVSHAYVRLVDFGSAVTVGSVTFKPGDLVHADQHGVLSIPAQVAPQLPAAADRIIQRERTIIDFCRSDAFSVEGLAKIQS